MTDYQEFLKRKQRMAGSYGFEPKNLNAALFPFQREMVATAIRKGRYAKFAECGMGKTIMQINWADECVRKTNKPSLILTPLAVAAQTVQEAHKFGYEARRVLDSSEVGQGINVANYDRLEKLDCGVFGSVVLDESSILKSFTGATKRMLLERFSATPYRLACTATPSPNDHKELGNHSEFLGIMESNRMLSRWFLNDTMKAGGYRLKGHAEKDFWNWVASWATAIDKPSDMGFEDGGFTLPPLKIENHVVQSDPTIDAGGKLMRVADMSATGLHREMRITASARADKLAEIVTGTDGPWILWCNTEYEADEIRRRIPEAVEVKGSDTTAVKESRLLGFAAGEFRLLLTKPSIAAFGLNYQHCNQMAFVGLSYSYEQLYQAIRRSWRYGQTKPVTAHIISADSEGPVLKSILEKQRAHERMKAAMVAAIKGEYTNAD
jgi:hypothetical protein